MRLALRLVLSIAPVIVAGCADTETSIHQAELRRDPSARLFVQEDVGIDQEGGSFVIVASGSELPISSSETLSMFVGDEGTAEFSVFAERRSSQSGRRVLGRFSVSGIYQPRSNASYIATIHVDKFGNVRLKLRQGSFFNEPLVKRIDERGSMLVKVGAE